MTRKPASFDSTPVHLAHAVLIQVRLTRNVATRADVLELTLELWDASVRVIEIHDVVAFGLLSRAEVDAMWQIEDIAAVDWAELRAARTDGYSDSDLVLYEITDADDVSAVRVVALAGRKPSSTTR